jgi:hypothetical protein
MDFELDSENEGSRLRRTKTSRSSTPRAARSTRRKKANAVVGGKHNRRNKHWSW